jgi:cyclase
MPLAYGGGISTVDQAVQLTRSGFEKVVLNTHSLDGELLGGIAEVLGSQAVVASVDVRLQNGEYRAFVDSGTRAVEASLAAVITGLEATGAGEVILQSIDREGTWAGYDLDLIRAGAALTSVPLIALGGAGSVADLAQALAAGASAVAAGSMFLFQSRGRGVLVNFPTARELETHGI